MPRFFTGQPQGDALIITGEDARHIARVLRMQPGESLTAFQWFSLWKESEDHYSAMVNPKYSYCGIAILTGPYFEGEDQTYATALFCSY